MTARPFEREARSAGWSLRLSLLPIPILIVAVVLHRQAWIEAVPLFVAIAISWGLALLSLIAGGIAMRDIWRDGVRGFGTALCGCLLSLAVLAIPAFIVFEMALLPRLAEISTDRIDPPGSATGGGASAQAAGDPAAQQAAYPDIVARHYPASPERVFRAAMAQVKARGWQVVAENGADLEMADASIDAVARTMILALPVDVSIRIVSDDDGTLVDMRSASRLGAHDLGDNARRVRSFFSSLDMALQGLAGPEETAEPDSDLPPLPSASPRPR
jgi:hypothetical protein